MSRHCSVCKSANRWEIETLIRARQKPLSAIAALAGVSADCIERHIRSGHVRGYIHGSLTSPHVIAAGNDISPATGCDAEPTKRDQQFQDLFKQCDDLMCKAAVSQDVRGEIQGLKVKIELLRLDLQRSGELQGPGAATNVELNLMHLPVSIAALDEIIRHYVESPRANELPALNGEIEDGSNHSTN